MVVGRTVRSAAGSGTVVTAPARIAAAWRVDQKALKEPARPLHHK